jgi:F-type H+-transporting ATPase subunit delta
MPETRLARRYAEALFTLARDRGAVDRVAEELGPAVQTIFASAELVKVLDHPEIRAERKCEALRRIFGALLSAEVMSFFELLVQRGRHQALPEIVGEFRALADAAQGVVRAEVVSATQITSEQAARLQAALARRTGQRVVLEQRVDPALLAGALVRVGSEVLDGSARGRLEQLRRSLLEVRGQQA